MDTSSLIPLSLIVSLFFYRFYSRRIARKKIPEFLSQNALIIDVRSPAEFKTASNPKSINIPLPELTNHLHSIPRDQALILCCASGARSAIATRLLSQKGFGPILNAGSWTETLLS